MGMAIIEPGLRSKWQTLAAGASVVGGILMVAWGLFAIRMGIVSRSWQSTDGQITVSAVREWREKKGPEEGPVNRYRSYDLQYRFTVGALEYVSGEISAEDAGGAGLEMAGLSQALYEAGYYGKLERKYPVGAKVTVYYEPANPHRSALEKGLSARSFVPSLGGLGLIGAGILGLGRRREP